MNVLWNRDERRPRAGWRVLLSFVAYVVALVAALAFHPLQSDSPGAAVLWLRQPLMWLPSAAFAVLCLWLLARYVSRERLSAFGLRLDRNWYIDFGVGLAIAVLLSAALFITQLSMGWITITGTSHSGIPGLPYVVAALSLLLAMAFIGLVQDPLLRSYQIRSIAEGLRGIGSRTSVILAAVISVAIVAGSFRVLGHPPNIVSPLNLTMGTIMFAVAFIFTGRLGLTMGLHLAWDFSTGNIFGFPLAGMDRASFASMFVVHQSQANVWTGPAAFGPIGGLLETTTFVVAIALILIYLRVRYGRLALATDLAVPRLTHDVDALPAGSRVTA